MADQEPVPVAARVRTHRARLRAQGLRPVQIWVPDVRSPRFAAAAHAQSAAIAASEAEEDDQSFVDAISWDGAADEVGSGATAGEEPAKRTE